MKAAVLALNFRHFEVKIDISRMVFRFSTFDFKVCYTNSGDLRSTPTEFDPSTNSPKGCVSSWVNPECDPAA